MHTKRSFRTGYDNELGSQVLTLPFEVCNIYLSNPYLNHKSLLILSFGATYADDLGA